MARIATLPQRFPEIGRIRSGKKTDDPKHPMEALGEWRFTSPQEQAIKAIASIYGGDPHPWTEREGEWEVFTESDTLEVQLPGDPIFTAYEMWGQGGNTRRCDGESCVVPVQDPQGGHLAEQPCICEEQGLTPGDDKKACNVTVRLKVVLPNVPGIGIWMLTSGSIYAAMELPAQCDLIDALRQRSGILIPCRLELQYREEKRAYEKFKRKYHVPTLQIDDSVNRITKQIQALEQGRSIAPAQPARESALPTATGAPGPPPGLPPAPPEPSRGQGAAAPAPLSRSYVIDELRELCRANDLDTRGVARDLVVRLQGAGVSL